MTMRSVVRPIAPRHSSMLAEKGAFYFPKSKISDDPQNLSLNTAI
jgi:hypothetical protein